tara:strand:+ start:1549 stop:1698 length:150 start_codon:yes stop_codon:yes gene_type:complete
MLDKNDLKDLVDIVDTYFETSTKKITLSVFQNLLDLKNKLDKMIKEMEN